MKCPVCGGTELTRQPGARHEYACASCGWGTSQGANPLRRRRLADVEWLHSRPVRAIGILLLWGVSGAILFGPWLTAESWFPASAAGFSLADFHRYYWYFMGAYLVISWFLDPDTLRPTRPRMPLETRREYRRYYAPLFTLLALAFPGRVVWFTLEATWRFFRSF